LPGELLGLDAINAMKHPCSAMALETSSICEIPYSTFEDLGADLPGIHRTLTRIMSKELLQEQNLLSLLGKYTVEERVAAFLLNLSQRFEERGFSPREFNLSMSRHDIGNYLGMAVETVSRVFGRFQEDGLLSVQRRFIQLHDVPAIRNLCGCIGKHC
jgi:CRP/FNR family transcriptional regulator